MEETLKNLAAAFIGESQARNRYTTYGKIALKEGYEQIGAAFFETADQETEHAKWLMRMINELKDKGADTTNLEILAPVPTDLGTTAENLKAAIEGEKYEHSKMYPDFAATAETEGLHDIAERLSAIAHAEAHHESRYDRLLTVLENETIFRKAEEVEWVCRKCGYIHSAAVPPDKCPSCGHPKAYFQLRCEEY